MRKAVFEHHCLRSEITRRRTIFLPLAGGPFQKRIVNGAAPRPRRSYFYSSPPTISRLNSSHSQFLCKGIMAIGFIRYYRRACPSCGWTYARNLTERAILLGSGSRACRSCKKTFADGSREWPQLGLTDRLTLFMPPGLQLFLVAPLVGVVIFIVVWFETRSYPEDLIGFVLLGTVPFAVIAVPWWLVALVQAWLSKRRVRKVT